VVGSCKCGNEVKGFMKFRELVDFFFLLFFLDCITDLRLLNGLLPASSLTSQYKFVE
jgi:hypothetical protein